MLAEERRMAIERMVNDGGRVVLTELSQKFAVSIDTIRRDLKELDAAGAIRQVRGGALRRSTAPVAYRDRVARDREAKRRIARQAASCVQQGMVVGLDHGTSAIEFIRQIPERLSFTAVTTNLPVAIELGQRELVTVIVPGGQVMGTASALVGSNACLFLSKLHLDLSVISACGIDAAAGLTAINLAEADVKRQLVERAGRTVVLATREKLGVVEPFRFADHRDVDLLVTDADPECPALQTLHELSIEYCGAS